MKLATVIHRGAAHLVAPAAAGFLRPLTGVVLPSGHRVDQMFDLIQAGPEAWRQLKQFHDLQQGHGQPEHAGLIRDTLIRDTQVQWLPPLVQPGKICGVAMNNSASNSRKISAPQHPAFFLKPASCLIGHRQPIAVRTYYGSVHPEPELAAVVGQPMRDTPPEQVLERLFGYTIFNDITGNGMRAEDRFHYQALYQDPNHPERLRQVEQHLSYAARYKGSDSFGVMGPWLVTGDEVVDPDNLDVRCWVGNEIVAQDSTAYYNYKVAEVVSFLSYFHSLHPGDVISFGTAFKPGSTRKSIHHANLQVVDGPVVVEIAGLGRQENPVVIETKELGRWRLTESA